ncbi:MAG: hypothetical protein ACTTJC_04735 [Campylobacter sp.]
MRLIATCSATKHKASVTAPSCLQAALADEARQLANLAGYEINIPDGLYIV